MEKRKEYLTLRRQFDKQLPNICGNCGSTENLDIHHVVPLNNGGHNVLSNLVRLCDECHGRAHGGNNFVSGARKTSRRRAKEGLWMAGTPPIGYVSKRGVISIVEEEADIVRYIFDKRYNAELSTPNIAKLLNYMAIPTKRGAKQWEHPVVKRVIDNTVYFGEYILSGENYGDKFPPILDSNMRESVRKFNEKYANSRVPAKCLAVAELEATWRKEDDRPDMNVWFK